MPIQNSRKIESSTSSTPIAPVRLAEGVTGATQLLGSEFDLFRRRIDGLPKVPHTGPHRLFMTLPKSMSLVPPNSAMLAIRLHEAAGNPPSLHLSWLRRAPPHRRPFRSQIALVLNPDRLRIEFGGGLPLLDLPRVTQTTISAPLSSRWVLAMPSASISSAMPSRSPAVSEMMTGTPSRSTITSMTSRVVPGIERNNRRIPPGEKIEQA